MVYQFAYDRWNQSEWDEMMDCFASSSFYQCWHYTQLHSSGSLRTASRAALFRDGQVVVMAAFRIKRLPIIGAGVADVDWGPVFHADQDFGDDLTEFLTRVREVYHRQKGLEVRFTPRGTLSNEKNKQLGAVMENCGFQYSLKARAYRTSILDVSRDLSNIRKNLAQKWRNRLNAAEKAGLALETGSSPQIFDRFFKIYQEMWSEKRFQTGVRLPVIRKIQYALPKSRRLHIAVVTDSGQDVGASVCAVCGDTLLYFLGATNPKLRGPSSPGYLLQWANIVAAKDKNLRWYDTGGFTDDQSDGVANFKLGLNGTLIHFPGRFDCASTKQYSRLFTAAEDTIRSLRQRLASH